MPRVLNVSIALVLLALMAPVLTEFDGKRWYVQVVFVAMLALVLPVALACLASAARPGSLGRALRRGRARRRKGQ